MLLPTTYFYQYWKEPGLTLILNLESKHNILVNQFIQQLISYLHYQSTQFHKQNKQSYHSHCQTFNNLFSNSVQLDQNYNLLNKIFSNYDNDLSSNNLQKKNLVEKAFLKGQNFKDIKQNQHQYNNLGFNQNKFERLTKDLSQFNLLYWGKSFYNFYHGYLASNGPFVQYLQTNQESALINIDNLIKELSSYKIIRTAASLDLHSQFEVDFFYYKLQNYNQQVSIDSGNKNDQRLNLTDDYLITTFKQTNSFKHWRLVSDFDIFTKYSLINWWSSENLNDEISNSTFLEKLRLNYLLQEKELSKTNIIEQIVIPQVQLNSDQVQQLQQIISPFLRLECPLVYQKWQSYINLTIEQNTLSSLWFETIASASLYNFLIDSEFNTKNWSLFQIKQYQLEFKNLANRYNKFSQNLLVFTNNLGKQLSSYYQYMFEFWIEEQYLLSCNQNKTAESFQSVKAKTELDNTNIKTKNFKLTADFRPQQNVYTRNKRISGQSQTLSVRRFIEQQLVQTTNSPKLVDNNTIATNNSDLIQTVLSDLNSSKYKIDQPNNANSINHTSQIRIEYSLEQIQQTWLQAQAYVSNMAQSHNLEFINSFIKIIQNLNFSELTNIELHTTNHSTYEFKFYDNTELEFFDYNIKDNRIINQNIFNINYAVYNDVNCSLLSLQTYLQVLYQDQKFDKNNVIQLIYIANGLTFLYQSLDRNLINQLLLDFVKSKLYTMLETNSLTPASLEILALEFNQKAKKLVQEIIKILNELQYLQQEYKCHILINLNLYQLAKSLSLTGNDIWKFISLSKFNHISLTVSKHQQVEQSNIKLTKTSKVWSSYQSETIDQYYELNSPIYQLACVNSFDQYYVQQLQKYLKNSEILSHSCQINISCYLENNSNSPKILQSKYFYLAKQVFLSWK